MNYLLDTHIFIWSQDGDPRLKGKLRAIIKDSQNIVYLSLVTIWEIVIKIMLKKLTLKTELSTILASLEFELLPIKLEHIMAILTLPKLHKDPFDRLLIAQAKSEKLTLLTIDPKIKLYF